MSGVVPMNMSESSYAIDSAWSLLQNDDKIEKIAPLLIPAAMALYGGYQGYRNVRDNRITDPVLGIKVGEGGDSLGSNLAEFGTGVAQGFVPGSLLGAGARRAGGKVAARQSAKEAAAIRAREEARQRAARDLVGAPSFGPLTARQSLNQAAALGPGKTGSYATSMGNQAYRAAGGGKPPSRLASTFDNMANVNRKRGMQGAIGLGAAGVIADKAPKLLPYLGGVIAQIIRPDPVSVDTSGYGSSTSAVGATGATNTPVLGNQDPTRRKKIWQGVEDSAQYGGGAVATGEEMHIANRLLKSDDMFVNRLGNEMMSEVKYRIHKAHCDTERKAECSACKKEDCLGKAHCMGERKAEGLEMVEHDGKKVPKFAADGKGAKDMKKKDDKKPAHGMVIVIGSKAGPGPFKNGKRQKLDSEKKDD